MVFQYQGVVKWGAKFQLRQEIVNTRWLADSLKENASAEKCFAIWDMMTGIRV